MLSPVGCWGRVCGGLSKLSNWPTSSSSMSKICFVARSVLSAALEVIFMVSAAIVTAWPPSAHEIKAIATSDKSKVGFIFRLC